MDFWVCFIHLQADIILAWKFVWENYGMKTRPEFWAEIFQARIPGQNSQPKFQAEILGRNFRPEFQAETSGQNFKPEYAMLKYYEDSIWITLI